MERINNHNAWLGVELLFKRLPAVQNWLKEQQEWDDKFIAEVSPHHGTIPNTI